jgi:hypothetical protein
MAETLTHAQIDAMEAGREMDALIAVHLFGWQWMRRRNPALCALIAPEGDEWERVNWYAQEWRDEPTWPTDEHRFTDWDRCGFLRVGRGLEFLPRYSDGTDMNATWQVIARVKSLSANPLADPWGLFARHLAGDDNGGVMASRFAVLLARLDAERICKAALKAAIQAPIYFKKEPPA